MGAASWTRSWGPELSSAQAGCSEESTSCTDHLCSEVIQRYPIAEESAGRLPGSAVQCPTSPAFTHRGGKKDSPPADTFPSETALHSGLQSRGTALLGALGAGWLQEAVLLPLVIADPKASVQRWGRAMLRQCCSTSVQG